MLLCGCSATAEMALRKGISMSRVCSRRPFSEKIIAIYDTGSALIVPATSVLFQKEGAGNE